MYLTEIAAFIATFMNANGCVKKDRKPARKEPILLKKKSDLDAFNDCPFAYPFNSYG